MKKTLSIILSFVAFYHIIIGLIGIFFKDYAVWAAKTFFSFNLTMSPQIEWILNPFAAYILIFGVFMAVAATNPEKYKNIIMVGVVLFAIRIIQRLIFIFSASDALKSIASSTQNIIHIIIVAIIGAAMLGLTMKLSQK
ncbi:MAG: hypothetical protein Q7K54_04500 [Candidatus Parcubacteria bacterium]|nr:hypothetical protein [Candidatus Parcubacteria bacterium]